MHTHSLFSISGKLCRCFLLLALASVTTSAAAQNNTFSGTYTFVFGVPSNISIQQNMFGQEVGFCNNVSSQFPFGYSCNQTLGQDVVTGTLIADGSGKIIAGSNLVLTVDPSSSQCSSRFSAVPHCPYKVPSGTAWSSTVTYVVGDEVDFTVGGKLLTFQAVKNNTNVPPSGNTCTSMVQPPNCTWDQLYVSASSKSGFTGTLTGTYAVQSNGSAVSQLAFVGPTGTLKASLAMIVPTAPLAIGQEVPLVGLPTLTNEFRGAGSAVRAK